MTGTIVNAILSETLALLQTLPYQGQNGATVLFKTNYKAKNMGGYSMPFVLFELHNSPGLTQWMGGVTRVDWDMELSCYNFVPDAYDDDKTSYSTDLLNFIDTIRRHFSMPPNNGQWLSTNMAAIETAYGFSMTLNGLAPADQLDADGLTKGWKLTFDSMAVDAQTYYSPYSTALLTTIAQNDNDVITIQPFSLPAIILTMSYNTKIDIPSDSYVPSITVFFEDGAPTVSIGTVPGGSDIMGATLMSVSNPFAEITAQQYFQASAPIYYTIAGSGTVKIRTNILQNYSTLTGTPVIVP